MFSELLIVYYCVVHVILFSLLWEVFHYKNDVYPNFKHLILEGNKPVYSLCTPFRNHSTESMNFKMDKHKERKRSDQERRESLMLTGNSLVSQSQ